ncbi:MAG: heavy-metal-associated domain-containing protein [Lautropia sp.]
MQKQFHVVGMTCQHCVKAVTQAVRAIDPSAKVEIDLRTGRVSVDSSAEREVLGAAIRDEGYTVN